MRLARAPIVRAVFASDDAKVIVIVDASVDVAMNMNILSLHPNGIRCA